MPQGTVFVTRSTLGGFLYSTRHVTEEEQKNLQQAKDKTRITAGASIQTPWVSGNANFASVHSTSNETSNASRDQEARLAWDARGGKTLLCSKSVQSSPPPPAVLHVVLYREGNNADVWTHKKPGRLGKHGQGSSSMAAYAGSRLELACWDLTVRIADNKKQQDRFEEMGPFIDRIIKGVHPSLKRVEPKIRPKISETAPATNDDERVFANVWYHGIYRENIARRYVKEPATVLQANKYLGSKRLCWRSFMIEDKKAHTPVCEGPPLRGGFLSRRNLVLACF